MEGMKARDMPDWLVTHLGTIAKIGAAGGFSTENTQVIRDLVKRAPITTTQFASRSQGAVCFDLCLLFPLPLMGRGRGGGRAATPPPESSEPPRPLDHRFYPSVRDRGILFRG